MSAPVSRRLSAREELSQLSWFLRREARPRRLSQWARVRRGVELPRLRRSARVPGSVWAVTMVRDELDILPWVLEHLLEQGVNHMLVADNGSKDGTAEYLLELANREPRLHVAFDHVTAYYQDVKMTNLALAAGRAGADWIVPFDADELWFSRTGSLAQTLRELDADVIGADWYDMVLLDDGPISARSTFLMDATPNHMGKVAYRFHPRAGLEIGNHQVARVGAHAVERLAVAHARYRTVEQAARKFRQGAQAVASAALGGTAAIHWTRGAAAEDAELAAAWTRVRSGRPEPLLDWFARGPMETVEPLSWERWPTS